MKTLDFSKVFINHDFPSDLLRQETTVDLINDELNNSYQDILSKFSGDDNSLSHLFEFKNDSIGIKSLFYQSFIILSRDIDFYNPEMSTIIEKSEPFNINADKVHITTSVFMANLLCYAIYNYNSSEITNDQKLFLEEFFSESITSYNDSLREYEKKINPSSVFLSDHHKNKLGIKVIIASKTRANNPILMVLNDPDVNHMINTLDLNISTNVDAIMLEIDFLIPEDSPQLLDKIKLFISLESEKSDDELWGKMKLIDKIDVLEKKYL